ncbi:transposase [Sporosarcina sp. Marseille-Q4063]|uniref:RNA-guided endonuclease InsQ/TnpB family protein n=1 Tax=Sporosarcina sp. Marseille-Q4063 TaxID=2810514 RepID=UPI001BAE7606|nr:RNA-guided endonuclease TnpB family protein [Sporosarcina sp. Marseille-Q4063]QUW23868.1 transposase [Sporosarcina sp. Marseille-Q4063]
MDITITAKIRLYPNEKDKPKLLDTARAFREALNFASGIAHRSNIRVNSSLQKITYQSLREKFKLKSQMACSVSRSVVAKYKSMDSNGVKNTLAIYKRSEYDLVRNRDYSFRGDTISLNTIYGRVVSNYNTKGMKNFFNGTWKFGTAKLIARKNKYYLHIPMSKKVPTLDQNNLMNLVGVDLGINFIATIYDNSGKTQFFSGKQIKQKRAHFKMLRQELQRKRTPSARRRLKKIGGRENRWMTDVNHQITKTLVNQYGENTLFVLENLSGIRKSLEKVRRKNRYTSVSWAFAQFRDFLTYKSQLCKSEVLLVDPKYTSQDCPKCSHRDKNNRNKRLRLFTCKKCNYSSNDDRIGAMNLYNKGSLKYLGRVSA